VSQNGAFNGAPPWRVGPDRPRSAPVGAALDPAEVAECRRLLGPEQTIRAVAEIEGYGCTSAEELGALRDLEIWGGNPWMED
jgi:hypothetical protein